MKCDRMNVRPRTIPRARTLVGIAAALCVALAAVIPVAVAAADRETLYAKAENLSSGTH